MEAISIDDPNDPRLDVYRNVKDRELARCGDRFIAEGEYLVRRMLASGMKVESVLVERQRAERVVAMAPPEVPVYVVPAEFVERVSGVQFHTCMLGCGFRPRGLAVADLFARAAAGPTTLVVCPEITNTANLGTIVRTAAAFGAAAMLLGERCSDPFYRQAARTSMGAVFTLPIVRSRDVRADLRRLREEFAVQLLAAVADGRAEPIQTARRPGPPDRLAIVLGNEQSGLDAEITALCNRRVTIPMHGGTDSLNVAAAAAVLLYHFTASNPPGATLP